MVGDGVRARAGRRLTRRNLLPLRNGDEIVVGGSLHRGAGRAKDSLAAIETASAIRTVSYAGAEP